MNQFRKENSQTVKESKCMHYMKNGSFLSYSSRCINFIIGKGHNYSCDTT